ncbi:XRE family transcriptional regulator [Opitutaceae bacterium TAV4]|nr:XRE family transcriptional regulator [Opitutaceae bacterium TAV4]RRK01106.1 XRE family transcriptional regulator [Opitutaceae bacterium TAV3]
MQAKKCLNAHVSKKKRIRKNLIGRVLPRIRDQKNISQRELADTCQRLGWSIARDTITRIENEKRKVSDYEVVILARALRVEKHLLFPHDDQANEFLES